LEGRGGDAESVMRLRSIMGLSNTASDAFMIEQLPAADGQILFVNRWVVRNPADVVIYVNGLESHGGWFTEVARALAQNGIAVYAMDRRGSGLNTRISGRWRDWVDDLGMVIERIRRACPRAKVHVASLCFGAAVATAFVKQRPRDAHSLIFMSPGLHVKVQPRAGEMVRIGLGHLPGLACNIPSPIRSDDMFTDSGEALWFLWRDKLRTVGPRAEDFLEAQRILRYVLHHLHEVSIPSAAFLAGKDQVVDNAPTRQALLQFSRKPYIVEYPDSEHIIFFGSTKDRLITDMLNLIA